MTQIVNMGELWLDSHVNVLTEQTSQSIRFVGVMGEVFYILVVGADATYSLEAGAFTNAWKEVAKGSLKDNELSVVKIDFYMPYARLKITPVAQPITLNVAAYGYPAVYSSS